MVNCIIVLFLRLDVDLRGANIIEKFVDEYEKLSTEGEKLINDKKTVCYILTNKYNNRTMLLFFEIIKKFMLMKIIYVNKREKVILKS